MINEHFYTFIYFISWIVSLKHIVKISRGFVFFGESADCEDIYYNYNYNWIGFYASYDYEDYIDKLLIIYILFGETIA